MMAHGKDMHEGTRAKEDLQIYSPKYQRASMLLAGLLPLLALGVFSALHATMQWPEDDAPFSTLLGMYSFLATLAVGVALSNGDGEIVHRFGRFSYWCCIASCSVVVFLIPSIYGRLHGVACTALIVGAFFISYHLGRFCVTISDARILTQERSLLRRRLKTAKLNLQHNRVRGETGWSGHPLARGCVRWIPAFALIGILLAECLATAPAIAPPWWTQQKAYLTAGFIFLYLALMIVTCSYLLFLTVWEGVGRVPVSIAAMLAAVMAMLVATPSLLLEKWRPAMILFAVSVGISMLPVLVVWRFDKKCGKRNRMMRWAFPALRSYRIKQYQKQIRSIQESMRRVKRRLKEFDDARSK